MHRIGCTNYSRPQYQLQFTCCSADRECQCWAETLARFQNGTCCYVTADVIAPRLEDFLVKLMVNCYYWEPQLPIKCAFALCQCSSQY